MKLFGQVIRTAVNVVTLPVAAIADVHGLSAARVADGKRTFTEDTIRRLKDEADENPREASAMSWDIMAGMLAVALFAGIAGACFGYAFGAISGEHKAADAWRSMQAHRDPSDDAGA